MPSRNFNRRTFTFRHFVAPARDILAYIRMITFGNLLGNTLDAFFSRLAGRPAPGSTLWDELGVLLLTAVGALPRAC